MVTVVGLDRHGGDMATSRIRLAAAERRETILCAAIEVFAEAGYRGGKVSDVAARVGVTEPVIFQNFGSKAALFAAVLERAAAEVRASLDDLVAESGSASRLLDHVLATAAHGHPGSSKAGPGRRHHGTEHARAAYGALFAGATAMACEPELTGAARNALLTVAAHLADLVRRAQFGGGADHDLDTEAAAWFLLSVVSARRLRAAAMPPELEPA